MKVKTLIGIPTLNNSDRLQRCLSSLIAHTNLDDPENPVVVVVSDDFSKPEITAANAEVCRSYKFDMLTAPQRYGIATQWNRLARHVPDSQVIVLVNDDIQFAPNWLDVLRFSALSNKHAGMVSLRSVQIPFAGKHRPIPTRDYEEATLLAGDNGLVSSGGACFAVRRELFDQVDGFDERYLCYYEEVDFGVQLALRGYFHFFAAWPILGHEVGQTIASNYNAAALLAESLQKFTDKWIAPNFEYRNEAMQHEVTRFPSLDALRRRLRERVLPPTLHWNSQWQNWRKP